MEILEYKENDPKEVDKQQLWKIMTISAGIDIATTMGVFATLGLGVVIEELIENAVSQMIAKYGKVNLTKMDNILGAIPIPGVTAVTVHCARKLFAIHAGEKMDKIKM